MCIHILYIIPKITSIAKNVHLIYNLNLSCFNLQLVRHALCVSSTTENSPTIQFASTLLPCDQGTSSLSHLSLHMEPTLTIFPVLLEITSTFPITPIPPASCSTLRWL